MCGRTAPRCGVIDTYRGAYAYTLATGELDADKRFYADVDDPTPWQLGYPHGAWSDGTTMWTGGVDTNKLYAFNMTETRTGGL